MTSPGRATIVWLHGIGQDDDRMREAVAGLRLDDRYVRGVYPCAPLRRIARVRQDLVPAWFDQSVFTFDDVDLPSAMAAAEGVESIVASASDEGPVLLAGFSQGAATALLAGLRTTVPVAGLLLYASYLPTPLQTVLDDSGGRRLPPGTPIWVGHGGSDWVVPSRSGRRVVELLTGWGYDVEWCRYPGVAHDPFVDAGDDIRRFLADRLAGGGSG